MRSKLHSRWSVIAFVCAAACPLSLGATTWHVSVGKTNVQGSLTTIQAAVDAAAAGDTIVLSTGTYSGPGNCEISLKGKALTIQSVNPLDPNKVAQTIIDCAGTQKTPQRGFSFIDCNGVALCGLTITHGLAARGGAIYCQNSRLDVEYCRILNNATLPGGDTDPNGGPGGGLYCEDSVVSVIGCFLSGNTTGSGALSKSGQAGAGGDGAGICGVASDIDVVSSTVTGNTAGAGSDSSQGPAGRGGDGGGLFGDSLRLVNSSVSLNAAGTGGRGVPGGRGGRGGGVCAQTAALDRCTVEANRAGAGGQVMTGAKSDNGAGGDGGGLYCTSLDIANGLVTGNRAGPGFLAGATQAVVQGDGGGIWCAAGTIRQCTIADNVVYPAPASTSKDISSSGGQGAGVFCTATTKVTGSILYGNTPDQFVGYDPHNVTYCNIKTVDDASGKAGTVEAPAFVQDGKWVTAKDPKVAAMPSDPNAVWVQGDYRLQATSPLIDAGDPNYQPAVAEMDLAGNARKADAAVDIGALEFQSFVPLYQFASPNPDKIFYTASEAEKDQVMQFYPSFWKFEGTAYYVFARASDPNLKPVYRFWSGLYLSHFYTIDAAEKDQVRKLYPTIWEFDGPQFYAYPAGHQPQGTIPVYRFWSSTEGAHFYTTDEAEKNKRAADKTWSYEGVAWYANATPAAPAAEPNAVYNFSGGAAEAQCTLTLKALLNGKETKIDKPNVTFTTDSGFLEMTFDRKAMTATVHELLVGGVLQTYQATIGGDAVASTPIPIVLSGNITFWGQAIRGPFGVDPNTLVFPTTGGATLGGSDRLERFTLQGAATVDGNDLSVNWDQGATLFGTGGLGTFDVSGLPQWLNVCMAGTLQWYCPQPSTTPLLEKKVKAGTLQIYVASLRIETTGIWQGKRLP